MAPPSDIVTLFDCDNTLLNNDYVVADLREHLEREFGPRNRDRYWEIFETLRKELGYADYLGALQRYRLGANNDPRLLKMSSFLVDYPFADRLFPSFCRMAMLFFSRARSSAQDCGTRSAVECLSIFIKKVCWLTSNSVIQPATT
jgi:hypothetical protein